MFAVRSASITDTGRVREINEDAVVESGNLFAVADGMGGHQAGEVASALALSVIQQYIEDNLGLLSGEKLLEKAITAANASVHQRATSSMKFRDMGTTVTALYREGDTAFIGNVGDSRTYMMRGEHLSQVTRDHSLVAELIASGEITPEEARVHPQRNVILRALGLEQQVKVDISSIKLDPGDRFLLASDGLTGMVTDEEIERVMRGAMEPMEAARALVASALDEGGVDNVSVVVVFFDRSESFVQASPLKGGGGERTDEGTAGEPSAGRSKRRMWIWLTVLALVVVILGAAAGVTYYLYNRSYYVGAKGGAVVLYRGFPFWGLAKVDGSVTGPKVALLGDESQQRLEEGMDVESHEEALAHIERLSAEAKKNTRVVPDVREIQVSDAQVAIEKSGLVPRKRWEAPPQSGKPVSENVVKRQEPKPYSEVRKGSAVYIYVYRPAKIPGEKVKGG